MILLRNITLAGLAVAALSVAQDSSTKGSISGIVQEAGTHKPIPGAGVSASNRKHVEADSNGRFTMQDFDPGTYTIRVYSNQGRGPQAMKVVQLASGQDVSLDFQLQPQGMISGRVLNENGEPAPGIQVSLIAREYRLGALRYMYASFGETNDEGQYAIPNIEPARGFLLVAWKRTQSLDSTANAPADPKLRKKTIVPTWYPNSDKFDASEALVLQPGEHREGVDMRLQRSASYCMDGLLAVDGIPGALAFQLEEREPTSGYWGDGGMFLIPPGGHTGTDGKFRVCELHPGVYRMATFQMPSFGTQNEPMFFGESEVAIEDKDLHNARVIGHARIVVTGEIVWDGKPPDQVVSSKIQIGLRPLTRAPFAQEISGTHADCSVPGDFAFPGLLADDYEVQVFGVPKGNYLKDIVYGGLSVLHEPMRVGKTMGSSLRVVLARDGATISLKILNKDGQPVPDCDVVLLPEHANSEAALADSMITGHTDQYGAYTSGLLAPGKYFALADTSAVDRSPETINRLWLARTHAQTAELTPNGQAQLTLVLADVQ